MENSMNRLPVLSNSKVDENTWKVTLKLSYYFLMELSPNRTPRAPMDNILGIMAVTPTSDLTFHIQPEHPSML
jgi:hypothetical protein